MNFYSENWFDATRKFVRNAGVVGKVSFYKTPDMQYEIACVTIGSGDKKIVINSGVHGIEGYFGSAAQNMFLANMVSKLSKSALEKYSLVLVHVINGWGMQNRMREVFDKKNGGLIDLNRNFGIDFSKPEKLPENPKYAIAHPVLLSRPDKFKKKSAIQKFRQRHLKDGVWAAISNGQYYEPYGLFYGGSESLPENKATMQIYDDIVGKDAKSLTSVGLHTGLGHFCRRRAEVTGSLLVSHPEDHKNTLFFKNTLTPNVPIVADNNAVNAPTLLGDLVDCLENRYKHMGIPVYTADFEIGTGEFPVLSPIYKRMDMGDARYDLLHYGKINHETWSNLTESWYPSDEGWKKAALNKAEILFNDIINYMNNTSR